MLQQQYDNAENQISSKNFRETPCHWPYILTQFNIISEAAMEVIICVKFLVSTPRKNQQISYVSYTHLPD